MDLPTLETVAVKFFDENKTTIIMCQHCANSDTNTIGQCALLKDSATLHKLKNKIVFQAGHMFFT